MSQRSLLVVAAGLVLSMGPAHGQSPFTLPGLGGASDGDQAPAVRLADDPKQAVAAERKALLERQQALMMRDRDAAGWEKALAEHRARRSALRALRKTLVLAEAPSEEARRWASPDIAEVQPPPPPPPPDDAGASDAGAPMTDGGVDAAPPPPPPPPARDKTLLLPVLQVGEVFLAPGVHPEQLRELDLTLTTLDLLEDLLSRLMNLHTEERTHLAEGLIDADKLLRRMDEKFDPAKAAAAQAEDGHPGLRDVERIALDTHRAHIERALARAQQRQAGIDTSDVGTDAARLQRLEPLAPLDSASVEPWAAFAASFGSAEMLRDEHEQLRRALGESAAALRAVRSSVGATRDRRYQLRRRFADHVLDEHQRTLDAALHAMRVKPDELKWATETFKRSEELRGKSIPRLESDLQALRLATGGAGAGLEGVFGADNVRRVKSTLVSERLLFERQKLLRDAFRLDLAQVLNAIIDGNAPPSVFTERYQTILDGEELERRNDDLETRCDGWRRAENEAQQEKAPPGLAANRAALVTAYAGLADVCMREDWVLGTQGRLGDVARFHLAQLEWKARGVFWFLWRGLVTVLLIALAIYVSRWLAHVTRRMAGGKAKDDAPTGETSVSVPAEALRAPEHGPDHPPQPSRLERLRRLGALMAYLGGILIVWAGAGLFAADVLWRVPVKLSRMLGWLTHPIFLVGENGVSLWSVARVGLWVMAAIWFGRMVRTFISDMLQHFEVQRGIRDTIGTIARYLVIIAGSAIGLSSVGIGLGALAVVFGVIGIGIGFGLQNIANNFISGFILLLERPIRVGDFVQVGDMIGEVRQISARATTIETRDAVSVIVPNSEFVSNRVINWTLGANEIVRCQVKVGVAYGTSVDLVRRVLLEVAHQQAGVLRRPRPTVDMTAFNDSSLDFVLHVWTRNIRTIPALISSLNMKVDKAFKAHGVQIPFPQRDVHIRSTVAGGPATLAGEAPPKTPPPKDESKD